MTRYMARCEAQQRWGNHDHYGFVRLRSKSVVDRCEVGYSAPGVQPSIVAAGPTWEDAFARADRAITADAITAAQIRRLRDRFGEGTRRWDPAIVHECDIALGDVTLDDSNLIHASQRWNQARARCAELLQGLP